MRRESAERVSFCPARMTWHQISWRRWMRALQRTLAILACLYLCVQTVSHTFHRWFEPRTSVLDKYDRPLAPEIDAAGSLDELVRRYEPLRRDVERLRAER